MPRETDVANSRMEHNVLGAAVLLDVLHAVDVCVIREQVRQRWCVVGAAGM